MPEERQRLLSDRGRIIAAIVSGLLAALCMVLHARNVERRAFGGELLQALVYARPLNAGSALADADLLVKKVPQAYLDDRAVLKQDLDKVVGQKMVRSARPGRFLLWSDLNLETEEVFLSGLLRPGRRAFTVPVDHNASIAGLLRPGDRVDVIGTFTEAEAGNKERVTVTLLQNIAVLATGERLKADAKDDVRGFGTMTLDVDIEEAELLAFAVDRGRVSLVLRGESDLNVVDGIPEKSFSDIFEADRRALFQKRRNAPIEELRVKK